MGLTFVLLDVIQVDVLLVGAPLIDSFRLSRSSRCCYELDDTLLGIRNGLSPKTLQSLCGDGVLSTSICDAC